MSGLKLICFILGLTCFTEYAAALDCFSCSNNNEDASGCAQWTGQDPTVVKTCDQCLTTVTYAGADGVRSNVARGCQADFPDKQDICVHSTSSYTCSCSSSTCNYNLPASVTCNKCEWTRDSGDKDFCKTGAGIPDTEEVEKCFSCMHTETYDSDGVLERVTRGCAMPDDTFGCVRDDTDYKCTCNGTKCNTQAAETRTCQRCDWYRGRSDTEDCRYGTDTNIRASCFQCQMVETFADDELIRVERDCSKPGDDDTENCDEDDNVHIGDDPATIVSSRTCTCNDRDSCNDVSGAGAISSSLVILVSSILIMV